MKVLAMKTKENKILSEYDIKYDVLWTWGSENKYLVISSFTSMSQEHL